VRRSRGRWKRRKGEDIERAGKKPGAELQQVFARQGYGAEEGRPEQEPEAPNRSGLGQRSFRSKRKIPDQHGNLKAQHLIEFFKKTEYI